MRRRELKKAISKYAKKVKFYRYGLIAKYLKHLEKEQLRVISSIPKVKCPSCESKNIELEYSDSEYSSYTWLSCNDCGEDFKDTFGYADVIESINCIPWWDAIYNTVYFDDDINFESIEWQKFCEEEILSTIQGGV